MTITGLHQLYQSLNTEYFDGELPLCKIAWTRALTRTAGNIDVRKRQIGLSVPLLIDAFRSDSLFGPEYSICGVTCSTSEEAIREILKHEMIHLWLFEKGLPHGHTPAFRAKERQIGQPRTRHQIALPAPKSGWQYSCSVCGDNFTRRRRYGRPVACLRCCKKHNHGRYDVRFKLKGKRLPSP